MHNKWVVNASPLIILGKISQIQLIVDLTEELIIPAGVEQEIIKGHDSDNAKIWLINNGKKFIKNIGQIDLTVASWDLGLGESEVISYCYKNNNYTAIIDDYVGRKCAAALSINIKGTLGILLMAKKEGIITNIKTIIQQLIKSGFRIHSDLYNVILKLAKEKE